LFECLELKLIPNLLCTKIALADCDDSQRPALPPIEGLPVIKAGTANNLGTVTSK
jgi:hypothetical protein